MNGRLILQFIPTPRSSNGLPPRVKVESWGEIIKSSDRMISVKIDSSSYASILANGTLRYSVENLNISKLDIERQIDVCFNILSGINPETSQYRIIALLDGETPDQMCENIISELSRVSLAENTNPNHQWLDERTIKIKIGDVTVNGNLSPPAFAVKDD